MTAQIRPNRMEVSDRFPMLGFTVRVDQPNVEAEVVLANDISLFDPQNKARRQPTNFYTSRENGTLVVPRGDGVFVVAPDVLARFVGSDKLYFGLATGHGGNGGLNVDALPRDGSPYISLRGFTGRTLRRTYDRGRRQAAPKLDWSGDAPRPGTQPAAPATTAAPATGAVPAGNGAPANGAPANGAPANGATPATRSPEYDDGFGPMPPIPARESAYRPGLPRPPTTRRGVALSSGTTARDALDWIRRKVEQAAAGVASDVSPPALYRLGGNSGMFIDVWKTALGISGLVSPSNALLAALPGLAKETGVTLSIGPVLETPVFGGGVGVAFAPDGQVALFGAGDVGIDGSGLMEFVSSLKAVLAAKMKLGYNAGGLDGFASIARVASLNVGDEIVGGAELWLDAAGSGLGGAVSIGVGFALELAADAPSSARARPRTPPARTSRVALSLSSGTTARDALDWIRRKVEQAVNVAGSDADPPSLYPLGDNSATFVKAWQATFGITGLLIPSNAFLASLPSLARETGVTLSIGPALDTPLFGGGVGVVFGPDGRVALFGTGEISVDFDGLSEFASSLKAALQAKMKLGYNNGGIEGFASLGKVAAVNVGEEIVVGAELWLDKSGNGLGGAVSIGVGLALELAAREPTASPVRMRPPARRGAPAAAMVVGLEDRQKARRYARDFTDIFQWTVPPSLVSELSARGFTVQTINDAVGSLNLDFYKVDITRFPAGWDGPKFLQHFIRHINDFVNTTLTEFIPYDDSDARRLASDNPLGTVFKLDFLGPDNAAIVISDVKPQYYAVSTINTPDTGDHPVSGHRMFGYANETGKTVFFTRAADRTTSLPPGAEDVAFYTAEKLWEGMQERVAAFMNDNGGAATVVEPFSERFNATAVREEFGHFDVAQGLALEEPAAPVVPSVLPRDARGRANRIGGLFGARIGEALDIGLEPRSLDALLDTLDPPARAQPMNVRRQGAVAKAQAVTRSINWDDVELIPQPTDQTCWAAAGAMIVGWRDQVCLTPDTIASICSRSTLAGLSPYDRATFASEIGLVTEPPQSYSYDGFYNLLATRGPLWVSKIAGGGSTSGHAIVVTGMYTDGDQSYVRIADPWDRVVGAPGAPGGYASTHATGSRYIMRYEDFQTEYELRIVGDPPTPQILSAGGTNGRVPNASTSAAPAGYAMALTPPRKARTPARPLRARVMETGTIAGTPVTLVSGSSGAVSWVLPQWTGIKHPDDQPPAAEAVYRDAIVALDQWPRVPAESGSGETHAWLRIRWQFNGTSLGHVYVEPLGDDAATGSGLSVTGTLEDDAQLHARAPAATVPGPAQVPALCIALKYVFGDGSASHTATSRVTLYADGTHQVDSAWLRQAAAPAPERAEVATA
jgi:hypothetical protein